MTIINYCISYSHKNSKKKPGEDSRDVVRNKYVSGSIGIALKVDKMVGKIRENKLRWFEHVMRREERAIAVMGMNV